MLNIVWPIFIILSFSYAIFSGNIEELNLGILNSSKDAITLTISLLGTMCLWNGIVKIAMNTNLIDKLTNFLKPIISFLFPDLKKEENIKKEISMNMCANILGLRNAATPLCLIAMKLMQQINYKKDRLSDSMMMFVVINTASIQIIPTTVIAIRNSLGSENPTSIVFPVWIATIAAAVFGIIATKIIIKITKKEK